MKFAFFPYQPGRLSPSDLQKTAVLPLPSSPVTQPSLVISRHLPPRVAYFFMSMERSISAFHLFFD